MYPPQTSLIPVSVTLASHVERLGIEAFNSWFHEWYMGVPFRYVAEPIVPLLITVIHQLYPNISLYTISLGISVTFVIVGIIGWFLLSLMLVSTKRTSFILLWILLILPWRYFSSIALSEVSVVVAKAFIPYVLFTYWHSIIFRKKIYFTVSVFFTILLFLINISTVPILLVGLISIIVAESFSNNKFEDSYITKSILISIVLFVLSFLLSTFWYGFGFWLTLFLNPSLGGVGIETVIVRGVSILRGSLPLILAIFSVYFAKKVTNKIQAFSIIWGGTFIALTVIRFFADFDFWIDWSSWFTELEIGTAFLAASFLTNFQARKIQSIPQFFIGLLLIFQWALTIYIYSAIGSPRLISNEIPEGLEAIKSISQSYDDLTEKDGKRIFISGTSTFWFNSFLPYVPQIRGGKDNGAIHPYWDHAAFQIREGEDWDLTYAWIQALGIQEVLVHTSESKEYYHDFGNVNKWRESTSSLPKMNEPDTIYSFPENNIVYSVNPMEVLSLPSPQKGDDIHALQNYIQKRGAAIPYKKGQNKYVINVPGGINGIQVLETYHDRWDAYDDKNNELAISKDPLGFMIIHTNSSTLLTLTYN